MKFRHSLVATAAFVLLSSQAFAQADPHHPEEDQPPVATGSSATAEGAAEQAPASSQTPAPAAPSSSQQQIPAAVQPMPMMEMMGQMQMMHMQQMHEAEMMHMQQMHQMETMHAMQMWGMRMHGMMSGMGSMPGMEMMQGVEMMPKRHGGGMPSSDSSAAEPALMGDAMAAPTSSDPDVAFVQAMIPHHEGAIAMAEEVLRIGDDEQVQTWAREIIAAQQAEIAEMRAWLDRHPQ